MPRRKKAKRKKNWLVKPLILIRNVVFIAIILSVLLVLLLRWVNLPYTNFMLIKQFSTDLMLIKIDWIEIEKISPHLLIAVVAAEDQKFPHHYGFDFKAILKAIEKNKTTKIRRGGSTISQQAAKNIFLWPHKSLFRKGLEAYFALLIESLWPKWRILEVYVNVAEFGPNIFGINNAAHKHFGVSASQLTPSEAALLAAVLPNPHQLNASKPSDYVTQRAVQIHQQVNSLGGSHYLNSIWE